MSRYGRGSKRRQVQNLLMEHVFLLLVYLGTGDFRKLTSGDMYFRSIIECNFFAREAAKRYGNYSQVTS